MKSPRGDGPPDRQPRPTIGPVSASGASSSITPLLEGAQILRLEPGDVIVLRTRRHLDDQEYGELDAQMADRFPGHKIVVLEGGMELDVLRPGGAAEAGVLPNRG